MHVLDKFRYCPVCGSKHFVEQNEKSKRCESCGFEYFLNPSSAVAAFILNEQGDLLVTRRKFEPGRGTLDLPGGIVLIGGTAILPGIVELAQEVFGVRVKLYVPNQVGIRNPAFAHVISLSEFAGQLTEVHLLAQRAVKGDEGLFQQPLSFGGMIQKTAQFVQSTPVQPAPAPEVEPVAPTEPMADFQQASQNKPKLADRFRGLIGSMFDE